MVWKTAACLAMMATSAMADVVSTMYPHVPLVMWSQRAVFPATNAYVSASMDETDVVNALGNTLTRNMKKDAWKLLSHHEVMIPKAEVFCVFLRKNLGVEDVAKFAENGASSFVQKAVNEAGSSVVVPHTTRTYSLRSALGDLKPTFVSAAELKSFLASKDGQAMISNGQADLLVVEVPEARSLPEADHMIEAAAKTLADATKGLVDFALTGDEAEPVQMPHAGRRLATKKEDDKKTTALICETGYVLGLAGGKAICFSHYVHMTPDILTGLLFGFFFLFLTYVGLSVLNAIQTPTRYPHHGPPKGKEY